MTQREYLEVGTVLYKKNIRSKRLVIRIKSDATVLVTLPFFASIKSAEQFVLSRIDWIVANKKRVLEKTQTNLIIEDNQHITHYHSLKFVPSFDSTIKVAVKHCVITVSVPKSLERSHNEVQEFVKIGMHKAFVFDAKAYLPKRLQELATEFSFSYSSIKITSAKTRWGSCSSTNSINFSCYIMKLPFHLIDFIIIHELCHTIHKNHGPKFHQLLDECTHFKKAVFEKELKQYSIR